MAILIERPLSLPRDSLSIALGPHRNMLKIWGHLLDLDTSKFLLIRSKLLACTGPSDCPSYDTSLGECNMSFQARMLSFLNHTTMPKR